MFLAPGKKGKMWRVCWLDQEGRPPPSTPCKIPSNGGQTGGMGGGTWEKIAGMDYPPPLPGGGVPPILSKARTRKQNTETTTAHTFLYCLGSGTAVHRPIFGGRLRPEAGGSPVRMPSRPASWQQRVYVFPVPVWPYTKISPWYLEGSGRTAREGGGRSRGSRGSTSCKIESYLISYRLKLIN